MLTNYFFFAKSLTKSYQSLDNLDSTDPTKKRYNHTSLIGVADPTGKIPRNSVFISGMGGLVKSQIFLTRFPCTESKDGIVVNVANKRTIKDEKAFKFLSLLPFGMVVFPLGENPLPPQINDGDLDGDLYFALWDDEILRSISPNEAPVEIETLMDSLINTEFLYDISKWPCI